MWNSPEPAPYADLDQAPVPSCPTAYQAHKKFAHRIASTPASVPSKATSMAVPALVPFWGGALPEGVGVGCVVLVDAPPLGIGVGVLLGSGTTLVNVVGKSVDVWIVTMPDRLVVPPGPPDGRAVVCLVEVPPPPLTVEVPVALLKLLCKV